MIKICMCMIIALVLIFFTSDILKTFPILTNLFTDNMNFILIMIVVIFIMMIDLYFGIILGLVLLYMAMYVNNNLNTILPIKKQIIQLPSNTIPSAIKFMPPNSNIVNNILNEHDNVSVSNVQKLQTSNRIESNRKESNKSDCNTNIMDDSEFTYNNTKPFPNNNIKPFQPKDYVQDRDTINFVQETINQECAKNQNDNITQKGEPDRSGYDVSGCRYDMKNSPQNLTQYGPPVSQCSAYDPAKAQICGTVFYPLNA